MLLGLNFFEFLKILFFALLFFLFVNVYDVVAKYNLCQMLAASVNVF